MRTSLHKQLPEFALYWARELETKESSLVHLKGGINNRVFRCGEDGRRQWVIKGYRPFKGGHQDRMKAEVDFLHYALKVAPGFTAELVHTDWERRCVVFQYLEGESFTEGVTPPKEAIKAALDFFKRLNCDPQAAKRSITLDAAEGYLRISEHINNIKERLNHMEGNHLQLQTRMEADRLVDILRSELSRIEEITSLHITQGRVADAISLDDRYISPSDFGFHNALLTKTGVRFIDFEFAGWDDPAKAVIDFQLQPRIPLCSSLTLINSVRSKDRSGILARCSILKPILYLKWCCIALNVLNPARLSDIISVDPRIDEQQIISDRLGAAKRYLSCLRTGAKAGCY
jgi:hypothetical protein